MTPPRVDIDPRIAQAARTIDKSALARFVSSLPAADGERFVATASSTRQTRQQVVTDYVRALWKGGGWRILPSQRTIAKELETEHGGTFKQSQVQRAIALLKAEGLD